MKDTRRVLVHHGGVLLLVLVSLWLATRALSLCMFEPGDVVERLGMTLWPVFTVLIAGTVGLGRELIWRPLRWRRGDWHGCSALPFRAWIYALLGSCGLSMVLAESYDELLLRALLGCGAAVFGLALVLMGRFGPEVRRAARAVDLVLFNLTLLVILGELGLRTLAVVKPMPLLTQDCTKPVKRIAMNQLTPGTFRAGIPMNSLGHFDTEFIRSAPSQPAVLCIGDSFSFGTVPHPYHFTTVAEHALGDVQLYNMGVPATNPPEYLHLLTTQGKALEPDLLVVNLFVGNDLTGRFTGRRRNQPLTNWLSRRDLLAYQVPRRIVVLAGERRRLETAAENALQKPSREAVPAERFEQIMPRLADPLQERPTMSDEKFMDYEIKRARLLSRIPEIKLQRNLGIVGVIRRTARPIPMLVMIIPDQFQVDDELWRRVQSATPAELDRDRAQRLLIPWLRERGIPYLDLLPILRAIPPMDDGSRHLYHLNDTHFNARGNRVAGEALAEFLAPHLEPLRRARATRAGERP